MGFVGRIGEECLRRAARARETATIIVTALWHGFRWFRWPGAVRDVLVRQLYFSGVEAIPLVFFMGVLGGISVVVQASMGMALGQSELVGRVLVTVILRELGPLLVTIIVLARSGTAMATELAMMGVNREILLLETLGVDPVAYLVVPRVLAAGVAVLCLAVAFGVTALVGGWGMGLLLGVVAPESGLFRQSVTGAFFPLDILGFVVKTVLPGMIIGAVCCAEGLRVNHSVTEVPQAATRAVVRALTYAVVVSVFVSVMLYA